MKLTDKQIEELKQVTETKTTTSSPTLTDVQITDIIRWMGGYPEGIAPPATGRDCTGASFSDPVVITRSNSYAMATQDWRTDI